MKYIKLFEGYKEDLQAEEERHSAELIRHKAAMEEIEFKYAQDNKNKIDKDNNIIDMCVEPLVEDYGFYLYEDEEDPIKEYKDMRYYMLGEMHEKTELTQDLLNALIKANRRIKSELDDREIYIHIGIGKGDTVNWLPSYFTSNLPHKTIPLPVWHNLIMDIPQRECLSVDKMAVRLDFIADTLKEVIGEEMAIAIII